MIDAGFAVRASEEALPPQERLNGEHIDEKIAKNIAAVKAKMK
jgi:hypothetical protein